ncbi:unnamed protein product [Lactuca saligna]|uniref:Uncharacterized protein n=1 Tax=Lactuca saligna TaxID=75948 RepID=A0AA36A352_LACSI|nr:unnamed protein product [Lactuca saligna]
MKLTRNLYGSIPLTISKQRVYSLIQINQDFEFRATATLIPNRNTESQEMSLCMSILYGAPLISTSPSLITSSSIVNSTSHAAISKSSNITPPPGVPLPSGSPSGSMIGWVLCIVLTFVVPFITRKWGPLIALKNRVDTAVDMAEHIAEVMEDVAGKVDKVIDTITDDLPEDSKLRKKLEAIDELIEGVAMSAHIANDIIDKVEEAEGKLESLILSQANEEKVSIQVVKKEEVSTHKD